MIISKDAKYLQQTLTSKLFEFAYKRIFSSVELGPTGYQYNKHALVKLPIIKPQNNCTISENSDINEQIYALYKLDDKEVSLIESIG